MAYRVEFDPDALKDFRKLDAPIQLRIAGFLRERLSTLEDPRSIGEALRGPVFGRYWKYRVGDWRLICRIEDQRVVITVMRLGIRGDVYR